MDDIYHLLQHWQPRSTASKIEQEDALNILVCLVERSIAFDQYTATSEETSSITKYDVTSKIISSTVYELHNVSKFHQEIEVGIDENSSII